MNYTDLVAMLSQGYCLFAEKNSVDVTRVIRVPRWQDENVKH